MGRLRHHGGQYAGQRRQADAGPYRMAAGHPLAAQPQQRTAQRTLHRLHQGDCASGMPGGRSSPTPTLTPARGLRTRGGVRIRRRRVSQAPDHDRRHHRQGQPRHLRLRHSEALRDIHASKEYGRWATRIDGRTTVPVCFLATNHTTGGNSRIADPQRTGRAGRRELRPHMAFDDERRGLRRDDLPQHSRGYPLRAVRDRPHRRRGLFVRRNGLRQEEIENIATFSGQKIRLMRIITAHGPRRSFRRWRRVPAPKIRPETAAREPRSRTTTR